METMIGQDIQLARELLVQGELVAVPTETVYGLAGNAFNEAAVLKIFEAKNRPAFNPLIVHAGSYEQLMSLAARVPAKAEKLMRRFMPGPFTLLLPKKTIIPDLVTAGSDLVALRVPDHPLTSALLQTLDFPLAAPSANPFGYISPTTARHVYEGLQGKIPYILDGGPCTVGLESTILGFDEEDHPVLYRSGGVPAEELEAVLGETVQRVAHNLQREPVTAGQLKSHYAPHKPLYLGDIPFLLQRFSDQSPVLITFRQRYPGLEDSRQYVLSEQGSLQEAARNLFTVLRMLDGLDAGVIIAERVPDTGLGRAINDRLERAQAENK